jgi:nucleoside-diphosphate-sugar epimerase
VRVFLAGATGVIGRPLVPALVQAGHAVTALARTPEKAGALEEQGAETAIADAYDAAAVHEAVVAARPEVVRPTSPPRSWTRRRHRASPRWSGWC